MVINQIIDRFDETHKRPRFKRITSGENILVFAPHPDDEIIGAGGTLLKHVAVGNPIHIVFVTDGRKGRSHKQTSDEIIAIRKNEAIIVCERLGATYTFLGCEDGNYKPEQTKIEVIKNLIKDLNPSDIFLPHSNDSHRDHFITNLLFYLSIDSMEASNRSIWEYEVWAPLIPNTVINISNEFTKKNDLMCIYKSQLQLISYLEIMEGLNKYRVSAIPIKGITHVEAFYCSSEPVYKDKIKRLFVEAKGSDG